jgi:hypothetical protein
MRREIEPCSQKKLKGKKIISRTESGKKRTIGCHEVFSFDSSENDDLFVGAFVALDTDGTDGQEDGKGLADLLVEPGLLADLLQEDMVGFPRDVQLRLGDRPQDPNGQTGPRERVAVGEVGWDL